MLGIRYNRTAKETRVVQQPLVSNSGEPKDNEHWGDILKAKGENTFRLYQLNVNGLSTATSNGQLQQFFEQVEAQEIDCMTIQEHRLNTSKPEIREQIEIAARRTWTRAKTNFTNAPIPLETSTQYGGTGIVLANNSTGRVVYQGSDSLGRWTYTDLRGKGHVTTIISAYQVCYQSEQSGLRQPGSAWAQQHSILNMDKPMPDPRVAFKRDLKAFLNRCRKKGHRIILCGDFNESLTWTSGLSDLCAEFQLTDAVRHMHGDHSDISTHNRGSKCIDYVLCDHSVAKTIMACGYTGYNEHFESDHRGIFMDFDVRQLFGNDDPKLKTVKRRGFTTSNPKTVSKYLDLARQYMIDHNMAERELEIHRLKQPDHALVEKFDRDLTRMCTSIEKKLTKPKYSKFSVALQQALIRRCLLRRLRGLLEKNRAIPHGLQNQLADYFPERCEAIQSGLTQCLQEQSVVKAELREILANQDEYRERMQDQQREAAAAARDTTKVAAIRQMKRAERERKEWNQIDRVDTTSKTGITSIEVPSANDPEQWVVIDTPAEVEKKIIDRNRKHFGQAQGTPFTESPLCTEFKWDGGTASADMVLDGTYDAGDLPESVQDILTRLCKPAGLKDLPSTIGMATWHQRIKQWRKTTTTSPSGRHLGHYKICAARHDARRPRPLKAKEKPDEAWWAQYNRFEELRWTRSQLSRCYVAVMNYATRFGYSLQRWKSIVNIMIPKEERNRKITRLRVIHIYEADYNLAMSIHWNEAIRNAELYSLLADEQYGGRKNRTAHDPVLIEELENEILRLSRHPIARMDIDATACYDRILLNLANLASRTAGLPSSVTKACAETLQEAGFRLLTALGISEEFYRHCDEFPIFGSGQGSGNSPSFWLLISSIILRAHKAKAYGATYVSPMVKRSVSISMTGFVDDVNNRCNVMNLPVNPRNVVHVLAAKLASDSQLWNDLLEATGGALNLSKCSYHLCHYRFSSTGIPTLGSTKHAPIRLTSLDHPDGVSIRSLAPSTSHKTLGYHMAPTGNDREQVKVLQQKSRDMAEKISLANVSRGAATKYYHAVFVKSIGYCSDLTHISKALWTKIQKPFLRAILPKMGFNRCHPRAALLGPPSHGGLGLTDFWVLQGANQACLFLAHFRQPDTTIGRFLRVTLNWAQFNAGVSWPILKFPERPLPHLEGHWIKSIREFAATNGFHYRLHLENWAVMLRQGDCPIMDLALMITTNKTTLSRINYCRLYLQVRLVSEVVSASGETMLQAALQGSLEDMPSAPTGVCAVQERPSDRVWGQWRSMWRKISTRKGRLFKPLGRWFPSQICRIRKWNWYYSAQEDTLFRTSGSFFYRHPVITSGGNRYDKNATLREIRLPTDAVPVDRVVHAPSFIVLQPYRRRFLPNPVSTALRQPADSVQPVRSPPQGRARIMAFLRSQATWLHSLHEATRIWQPPSKLRPWFVDDRNMILSVHPHYHGNEADTTGWCLGTEDSLVATGFFRTRCDHNRGRLMLEILGLLQGITAYIGF